MRGLVISAVVSLLGLAGFLVLLPNAAPQSTHASTPAAAPVEPARTTTATPGAAPPVAEPTPPAAEPTPADAPAEVVAQTATKFVEGWLTTDPTVRGQKLAGCTTPQLLEGLVHTQPHKIPRWSATGPPDVAERNPGGGVAIQRFTNGRTLEILVVPGEQAGTWVVAGASEG